MNPGPVLVSGVTRVRRGEYYLTILPFKSDNLKLFWYLSNIVEQVPFFTEVICLHLTAVFYLKTFCLF